MNSLLKKLACGFGLLCILVSSFDFSPVNAVNSAALFFNINAGDNASYSVSTPSQWNDLSTTQRNGSILGSQGLTYNATTKALEFPGGANSTNSLGYVDMGSGFNNFGTGITIEFEGHFGPVNQSWERVFDFGNGAEGDNIWVGVVGVGASNRLATEIWRDDLSPKNTPGRCVTSSGLLVGNQFDKWVITLDGSTCRMYRNGIEVSTTRIDNGIGNTISGPSLGVPYPYLPRNVVRANNYIGRSNWGVDAAFDGALKYVRIYTEALTAQEVSNNSASYTLTYSTTGSDSGNAPSARTGNGLMSLDGNTGNLVKAGNTFSGWATSSGQSTAISGSYNLTANTTLYPVWTVNTYTVTYDEHGGSAVPDGTFPHGGSLTFPTNPTQSGYTFNGWFSASTGGTALTASQVAAGNANVTLHAQWSLNQSTSTTAPASSSTSSTTPSSASSSAPSTTAPAVGTNSQSTATTTSTTTTTTTTVAASAMKTSTSTSSTMPRTGGSSAPLFFFASLLMLVGHLLIEHRKTAVH